MLHPHEKPSTNMFEDQPAITMSSKFCKLVCIGCLYASPFIFQTVGLFTPKWISTETCDAVGLLYSCFGGPENNTCRPSHREDELDTSARGLQISSFALMVIGLLVFFIGISCARGLFNKCDPETNSEVTRKLQVFCDTIIGCLVIFFGGLLLSISGILNISGCIVVATKFSGAQLGYSFYLV
ncbi:uncharacterized protein LOC132739411 isoform X2 [Ruditapes philippinarum]|uniref:uncharacterized protein LOC132739411 isoform X2 n=1 Tax=Ruditapes philippinarum TaxID=129788 RepID=UPI00295BE34F|nr:uncharacterized protein LOC132739411 isoform X2 [Ruditapes philippinarum]